LSPKDAEGELKMGKICGAALVIIIFFTTNLDADVEQAPVRISIVNETPSGNGSERDCIVIYRANNYHVERRHQAPSTNSADLVVFESRLIPDDLGRLEDDLLQLSRSDLPEYAPPAFPINISTFQSMTVEVKLNGTGHTFGYLEWPNKDKLGSPNNSPEETKQSWQKSAAALRPLYNWTEELIQRSAKSSNVDRSASNLCGEL
jgi:hypothetical protein